jgi:hypothetical protein
MLVEGLDPCFIYLEKKLWVFCTSMAFSLKSQNSIYISETCIRVYLIVFREPLIAQKAGIDTNMRVNIAHHNFARLFNEIHKTEEIDIFNLKRPISGNFK